MEKELYKAFEQTTTRNLKMIEAYTKDTRALVRDLEEHVHRLKGMVAARDREILEIRNQMSLLQAEKFKGGTQ